MALPLETPERQRFYTVAEFMALPFDESKRYELVRGTIKEMSHPGREHTLVTDNLYGELRNYVRGNGLGRVLPPGGFELKIPGAIRDTVRSPDLTYLAKGKATGGVGAFQVVPDLAIEIYSPNDRAADYREKLEDYRDAGWNLVWIVYPIAGIPKSRAGKVEVYHLQESLKPVQVLAQADRLDGENVIPGFSMSVAALFDYADY